MCYCGIKGFPGYCNICTDDGKIRKVCKTCTDSSYDYPYTCSCGMEIRSKKLMKRRIVTACGVGDIEELKSLLDNLYTDKLKNAEYINCEYNNDRPLTKACLNGKHDVVKILLDHGADVNAEDDYLHNTGLHNACQNCDLEMVKLLLANGARKVNYNIYCDTPEDLASYCDDPDKQDAQEAIIELLTKP